LKQSHPWIAVAVRWALPFTPLAAGVALGLFLCAVLESVAPYRRLLLAGCLAGQMAPLEPWAILAGAVVLTVLAWIVWSWLLGRRSGERLPESLRQGAIGFIPLLLLMVFVPLVHSKAGRWVVDPLLLACVMTACAIQSAQWTKYARPVREPDDENARAWLWTMFLAAGVVFATLSVLQYRSWNVPYVDSGINEEMLYKTLQGQFLRSDAFKHIFLGEHVMLTQLLWLPLYALWPSMEWISILNAFLVAAGVFPIWGLARRNWGDGRALCFPLLYLLQPALHFAVAEVNYNTYRYETVLIPLVLFGAYYLERERWFLAALFGAMVLLSREDMALVLAAAGVYVAWRKKRVLAGIAMIAVSIGYLWICLHLVIPHFNTAASHVDTRVFQGLGDSPGEILRNLVTRPGLFWDRIVHPDNALYLCYLLLPLGLLCFGHPALALIGTPIVGVCMLTAGVQASIYFHYQNAPFALLVAAAPLGGARLAEVLSNRLRWESARTQVLLLTFAISGAVFATIVGSKSPLSINFYAPRSSPFHYSALYQRTEHTRLLDRIERMIPRESKVAASIFAGTHFTHHRACLRFPESYHAADFVVVDMKARWSKGSRQEMQLYGEQGLPGFELILVEDGVFVFRRKVDPSPPSRP